MVSGYPTSMIALQVDGLSTDPSVLGCHSTDYYNNKNFGKIILILISILVYDIIILIRIIILL